MNKKVQGSTVFIIFVTFAIVMTLISLYLLSVSSNDNNFFAEYNKSIENELGNQLLIQEKTDEKIKELQNKNFSIENPYILVNPYKISPLSALVFFDTKEPTEVEIYINDIYLTKTELSQKHIIPVYGLYANANNYVLLKTSTTEKIINIKTSTYDNEIKNSLPKLIDSQERIFTLKNNNAKTSMQGFDKDENLMFYLNFGYIDNVKFTNDHFFIKYSPIKNLQSIKVEMDYLGRIYSVSTKSSEFEQGKDYQIVKLYGESVNNYKIEEIVDNEPTSDVKRIKTETINNQLVDAEMYNGKTELYQAGNYLIYNFDNKIDTLLLVKRNSSYTYEYDVKNKNIIKIDLNSEASVFVKINDKYYCLLRTIHS